MKSSLPDNYYKFFKAKVANFVWEKIGKSQCGWAEIILTQNAQYSVHGRNAYTLDRHAG